MSRTTLLQSSLRVLQQGISSFGEQTLQLEGAVDTVREYVAGGYNDPSAIRRMLNAPRDHTTVVKVSQCGAFIIGTQLTGLSLLTACLLRMHKSLRFV
jgi:hypothetical protein